MKDISDYTLSSPPPADHPELADWVWDLFEESYSEKERLGLMDRWKSNYKLLRGNHWGEKARGNPDKITINLFFANVQRTVANITAKNPVAQVIDLDGNNDQVDDMLTLKMKKWWNETEQQAKLAISSLNNETYGITVEKAVWDSKKKRFIPVILDPYSYFPAPGYYEDQGDIPYEIHAFSVPVYQIESTYGVEDISAENVKQILGREDREDVRPNNVLTDSGVGVVLDQTRNNMDPRGSQSGDALVIECWVRDNTTVDGIPLYPDGVRVITICNRNVLLNDMPNPNLNLELDEDIVRKSFAWGRRPFYKANSYEDTTSNWGFSAGEQTGDLNKKINEIVSRIASYCNRALFPTLIVEKGAGITKQMINNKPGLVLMPTRPNARIEYLAVPNLPSNFFQTLDLLISFHDRVYQIEDADRGVGPAGVTAASAIVSLQERNAVLIRHKIRATEFLCRMRGRWNISFIQNFSVKPERITMPDASIREFSGIDLAGRQFNYIVESDSTVARTSAQDQEQAVSLFKINAIDRTALLDELNYKNRKQIIERMGETQLDEALNVLEQAGLDHEQALQLRQFLMEPQNGPEAQPGAAGPQPTPQPGTPRAQQGGV